MVLRGQKLQNYTQGTYFIKLPPKKLLKEQICSSTDLKTPPKKMIDKSSISKHYIESLKAAEKNDLLCAMRPEKRTLQELRMNALQCQSLLSLKICQVTIIQ